MSNWSKLETKNRRKKSLNYPPHFQTNNQASSFVSNMSDDEVPEPSATASEIGPEDEEAASDQCF